MITAKGAGRLEHAAWAEAFEGAVRSLRIRVIGDAEAMLRSAAGYSHFPLRRLDALLPDAEVADALLQRLLAEGMSLELLEGMADDPAMRRARALAITAGWEGAVRIASADAARWRALAAEVGVWRRSLRPFWITAGVCCLLALVAAAWLGGQLRSPLWFAGVRDAFWRLPWP